MCLAFLLPPGRYCCREPIKEDGIVVLATERGQHPSGHESSRLDQRDILGANWQPKFATVIQFSYCSILLG